MFVGAVAFVAMLVIDAIVITGMIRRAIIRANS
jgi:hypothetical protein